MFGKKIKLENDNLRETVETLTSRVSSLEEANRLLTEAIERNRTDLVEREEKLKEAEAENGRLLLELERERALTLELRTQLEDAVDIETEAAELNAKLDRIGRRKANYEAKIANLEQTILELRGRLNEPESARRPVDFIELEEEQTVVPTPKRKPQRPYGEPFRPEDPSKSPDRSWLNELPRF